MMPLPCIVCNKPLEAAFPMSNPEIGDENHPLGGTAFTTAGHFGSGVFDPMDGKRLEINVCDGCMQTHIARVWLYDPAKDGFEPVEDYECL